MDPSAKLNALSYLISIIGAVMTLMLGIIGYFARDFVVSTKELKVTVQALHVLVTKINTKQQERESACEYKHEEVNRRLNAHSEQLKDHESRISKGGL